MIVWNSEQAQRATRGMTAGSWEASGVSIDTRTLVSGDMFVALKDQRDGHEFVNEAFMRGASTALVSRVPDEFDGAGPLLIVPDVLKALEDMARFRRQECQAKIIAVTGSAGKTSTKNMLNHVLSRQGPTHAAEKSYNNHWGVPLTLARMPIEAQFGIFEIGMNHPGEIAPLSRLVSPHVAIITTVGKAHLEAFDSVEGIAREKAQIFAGLCPGGTAIINVDASATDILIKEARQSKRKVIRFGFDAQSEWQLRDIHLAQGKTQFAYFYQGRSGVAKVAAWGHHFAHNALAALAATQAVGADEVLAGLDLGNWVPPDGRGVLHTVVLDPWDPSQSITLIDDSFNANPMSLLAGLNVLAAHQESTRHVAFLSDMLELGPESNEIHASIAHDPICRTVSKFHCIGPLMKSLYSELPIEQQGSWFETAEEMAANLKDLIAVGDTVLVKGSKASKASLVAQKIKQMNQLV